MEKWTALLPAQGAEIGPDTFQKLSVYREMLVEWNQRMDLTSVPEEEIGLRHLGDSLLPVCRYPELFPKEASLADVGTGAGLPGLPIAIFRPDLSVTLIESMRRRCDFLEAVRDRLELPNVRILCVRAEEAGQDRRLRESFDRTVSRAVAAAPVLLEYLLPLTKTGGYALCWKGPGAIQEAEDARAAAEILGSAALSLFPYPYPGEERLLLAAEKTAPTPDKYPRRPGIPAKRPLGKEKRDKTPDINQR